MPFEFNNSFVCGVLGEVTATMRSNLFEPARARSTRSTIAMPSTFSNGFSKPTCFILLALPPHITAAIKKSTSPAESPTETTAQSGRRGGVSQFIEQGHLLIWLPKLCQKHISRGVQG